MQLNVFRELRRPVGSVASFDIEDQSLRTTDFELSQVAGSVTLLRTDRGLLVSVRAKGQLTEKCARCLAPVECSLDIDFEEEYVPAFDVYTGTRLDVGEEDDTFRIGPDFVLDLREGTRQHALISEPTKPLCKPNCAGLCQQCGADLNLGSCGCVSEGDDRWAVLSHLGKPRVEGS